MFARTLVRTAAAAVLLLASTGAVQPPPSRSGTFAALDGHRARGGVRLRDAGGTATLTLGRDFSSERGPNVDLYLSKTPNYRDRQVIRVGDLRRARGPQAYAVRAPRDLAQYRYVIAWCHTFNVGIARAVLAPAP
ncbi:MAG TPA: DM13 domain-containing protein [Longimicrobium sp.]